MCRHPPGATIDSMNRATSIAAGACVLLVVDLFLPWQEGNVQMLRFDVEHTSSGWSGWGAAAGICAVVVIISALAERPLGALARTTMAVLIPLFTALAALTGDAQVGTGMMDVQANATRWPAWVGLALAVIAAAMLAPAIRRPAGRSQPHPA